MTDRPRIRRRYTDPQTMYDLNSDCGEGLLAAGLPPALHDAARRAGRQLERFKQRVKGRRSDGRFMTRRSVPLARRTLLIVLAEDNFAIHTFSVADLFNVARATFGEIDEFHLGMAMRFALLVGRLGESKIPPKLTETLFAVPEAQALVPALDRMISQDICPAVVGLVGCFKSDVIDLAWPLALPLAPYRDALGGRVAKAH